MELLARTLAGDAFTELTLSLFRVNNLMLAWGDRLVAPLGLTSARWQILGAVIEAQRPQPVAWLARDLGANRQNIQRIVNDLEGEGLLAFLPNPHHKRAHLVSPTNKGKTCFEKAMSLYDPGANALSAELSAAEIKTALKVIEKIKVKLESESSLYK